MKERETMTEHERQELEAHAAELERTALDLYRLSKVEKYSHDRRRASSAASAYEIQAVWLRGFLRRHTDTAEQEQVAEEDRAANEGRDASRRARWG